VHLEAFRDLAQAGGFAWGVAALVHMYDHLNDASQASTRQLGGYITLLQVRIITDSLNLSSIESLFFCIDVDYVFVVLDIRALSYSAYIRRS